MNHKRLNTLNDFYTLSENDHVLIIDKDNKMLNAIILESPHRYKFTDIHEMWVDIPSENLELPIGINKYLNHNGWFRSIFKEDKRCLV